MQCVARRGILLWGGGDGEVKQEVGVLVQYVEEREKVEGVGLLQRETI